MVTILEKLKMKSIGSVHPSVILALAIVGTCFFLTTSLTTNSFPIDAPHFQLARSSAFNKIVECSDTSDGLGCFHSFRSDLEKEAFASGTTSIAQSQLESCLDLVAKNANDLALLLNIQTCFHQTDILNRAIEFNSSTPKTSWWVVLGIFVSLFIQMFIAIHSFVTFVLRNKEMDYQSKKIRQLAQNFELLNEKQIELYSTVTELITNFKSETKNIQGRLNRGGDIRRELEKLNQALSSNISDIQLLKEQLHDSRLALASSDLDRNGFNKHTLYRFPSSAVNPFNYREKVVNPANAQYVNPRQENGSSLTKVGSSKVSKLTISKPMNTFKQDTPDSAATTSSICFKYDNGNNKSKTVFTSKTSGESQNSKPKVLSDIYNVTKSPVGVQAKIGDQIFDLSTSEGMEKWKVYIKQKSVSPSKSQNPTAIKKASNMVSGVNSKENDDINFVSKSCPEKQDRKSRFIFTNATINDVSSTDLHCSVKFSAGDSLALESEAISNIQVHDKEGKPFRRLFIPGTGWVSAKKFANGVLSA